MNGGAKPMAGH